MCGSSIERVVREASGELRVGSVVSGGCERGTSDGSELLSGGHHNSLDGADAGLFELLDVESADAARLKNVEVFIRSRSALLLVAVLLLVARNTPHRRRRHSRCCTCLLTTLRTDTSSVFISLLI